MPKNKANKYWSFRIEFCDAWNSERFSRRDFPPDWKDLTTDAMIGKMWQTMPDEVKEDWKQVEGWMAEEKKALLCKTIRVCGGAGLSPPKKRPSPDKAQLIPESHEKEKSPGKKTSSPVDPRTARLHYVAENDVVGVPRLDFTKDFFSDQEFHTEDLAKESYHIRVKKDDEAEEKKPIDARLKLDLSAEQLEMLAEFQRECDKGKAGEKESTCDKD